MCHERIVYSEQGLEKKALAVTRDGPTVQGIVGPWCARFRTAGYVLMHQAAMGPSLVIHQDLSLG